MSSHSSLTLPGQKGLAPRATCAGYYENMRRRTALAIVALVAAVTIQAQTPSATAILDEATALAARDHRAIFAIFHASW